MLLQCSKLSTWNFACLLFALAGIFNFAKLCYCFWNITAIIWIQKVHWRFHFSYLVVPRLALGFLTPSLAIIATWVSVRTIIWRLKWGLTFTFTFTWHITTALIWRRLTVIWYISHLNLFKSITTKWLAVPLSIFTIKFAVFAFEILSALANIVINLFETFLTYPFFTTWYSDAVTEPTYISINDWPARSLLRTVYSQFFRSPFDSFYLSVQVLLLTIFCWVLVDQSLFRSWINQVLIGFQSFLAWKSLLQRWFVSKLFSSIWIAHISMIPLIIPIFFFIVTIITWFIPLSMVAVFISWIVSLIWVLIVYTLLVIIFGCGITWYTCVISVIILIIACLSLMVIITVWLIILITLLVTLISEMVLP